MVVILLVLLMGRQTKSGSAFLSQSIHFQNFELGDVAYVSNQASSLAICLCLRCLLGVRRSNGVTFETLVSHQKRAMGSQPASERSPRCFSSHMTFLCCPCFDSNFHRFGLFCRSVKHFLVRISNVFEAQNSLGSSSLSLGCSGEIAEAPLSWPGSSELGKA